MQTKMNKYHEAFYEIITALKKDDLYMGDSSYDFIDKDDITLIQELVDKETPKKPVIQEIGQYIIRYVGKCECGEFIARSHKYCHGCGQRLDWSEE